MSSVLPLLAPAPPRLPASERARLTRRLRLLAWAGIGMQFADLLEEAGAGSTAPSSFSGAASRPEQATGWLGRLLAKLRGSN